jgi:hypothetical protein
MSPIVSPSPAVPSTLMPLPCRSTSAGFPAVLDTVQLPCSRAAQKFRLASKLADTMGNRQTTVNLIMHFCLRGAARNRWTRDSGRDELVSDRNQRILPQLPSFQFSQTIHYHTGNWTESSLLCPRVDSGVTFGVVCHRVSSGRELLSVAPPLQSSEESALLAAILSHRYS